MRWRQPYFGMVPLANRPEPQTVAAVNIVSDSIDQLTAAQRLAEVAEILAAGILRLRARQLGTHGGDRRAGSTGLLARAKRVMLTG